MRVALRNIHHGRPYPGTGRPSLSILEPVRMPPTDAPGMGDFVAGSYALPQNPVVVRDVGLGDFVAGDFVVPQNPIRDAAGMSGCGCGGSCGPCSGMGAIDFSPSGTGIATSVGMTFPNWYVYAGVGALLVLPVLFGGSRRRRR